MVEGCVSTDTDSCSGFLSTSIFCSFNQFVPLWPLHSARWRKHGGTECRTQVYSTNWLSSACSTSPSPKPLLNLVKNKSSCGGNRLMCHYNNSDSKQVYGLMRSDKRRHWQPSCLGNSDNKAALTNGRLHGHGSTSLKEACRWIIDCCIPGRRLLAVVWPIRGIVAV